MDKVKGQKMCSWIKETEMKEDACLNSQAGGGCGRVVMVA